MWQQHRFKLEQRILYYVLRTVFKNFCFLQLFREKSSSVQVYMTFFAPQK